MTSQRSWIWEGILLIIALFLLILAQFYQNNERTILLFALIIGGGKKALDGIIDTLKNKRLNVELLMIFAAAASFYQQAYIESIILILIFGVSGFLETYILARNQKNLHALLDLAPKTIIKVIHNQTQIVPVEQVMVGDEIILKPGQILPVDAKVLTAASFDYTKINGEALPVTKKPGESVMSGAIGLGDAARLRVHKTSANSTLTRITNVLLHAQQNPSRLQAKIHRFETIYVWLIILLALLCFFLGPLVYETRAIATNKAIMILVVGSPCAVVASIAPAILAAVAGGARQQIFIKNGRILETIKAANHIVFDKTGTLTTGVFQVETCIRHYQDITNDELSVIYTLEKKSTHPLAQAIVNYLEKSSQIREIKIDSKEVPGIGIKAKHQGNLIEIGRTFYGKNTQQTSGNHSIVHYSKNGSTRISFLLKDDLASGAADLVAWCHAQKVQVSLLTGDHPGATQPIAKALGIDTVYSKLLPEDKANIIRKFKKKHTVLMIGDGFNDALALQEADAAIATQGATDVSLEVADVILMRPDLGRIKSLIKLSQRFWRIIIMNLGFSIFVIGILLISNLFFAVSLPLGVSLHEGSTLLVIINALRLLFGVPTSKK